MNKELLQNLYPGKSLKEPIRDFDKTLSAFQVLNEEFIEKEDKNGIRTTSKEMD